MNNPNNALITKKEVEDILNYFGNIGDNDSRLLINNIDVYQKSFVHESYYQSIQNVIKKGEIVNNTYINYFPDSSNERLEYLGDHILKAVMGRYLFERFPDEREGTLTKIKIKIEKCSMLHKIGVTLGFKKFLLLSLQVENQTILDIDRGRNTPSYYEDAFEAFIGSIVVDFGDSGYKYAERFARNVIENIIDFAELMSLNDNYKDILQRYFQSLKWKTPAYISINEEGPLYRKVFTRIVTISKEQFDTFPIKIQKNIQNETFKIIQEYKKVNKEIYEKLFDYTYIIGIGFGRKVTCSEQECAKRCMETLCIQNDF